MESFAGLPFSVQQFALIMGVALLVAALADRVGLLRSLGRLYRIPIVLVLASLWIVYVWWWIAAVRIAAALTMLIVLPVLYLPLQAMRYVLALLGALVLGGFEKVELGAIDGYWDEYPERYGRWCRDATRWGFPRLYRWWRDGLFSS